MNKKHPYRGAWIFASAPKNKGDLTFTSEVSVEAAAADKTGPPRFAMDAYSGGLLRLAAFDYPVVVDLSGLSGTDQSRPVYRNHKPDLVVGHTERIVNDGKSLKATGIISGAGDAAREVRESSANGFPWQASIGARPIQMQFVRSGDRVTVNAQTFTGPIYVARRAHLGEISFVPLGADETTSARIAAKAAEGSAMEFEQWLKAKGFDLAALSDQSKQFLQAQYDAEQALEAGADDGAADEGNKPAGKGRKGKAGRKPAPALINANADGGGDDQGGDDAETALAAIRTKRAEDIKRIGAIEAMADTYKDRVPKIGDIQAEAITGGWTVDQFELKCLRDARPKAPISAPNINAGAGSVGLTSQVIEAACCMTGKLSDVEKRFDDKTLEAADKRFKGSLGLQEMLLEAAWANGYAGRNFRSDPREVMRYAFRPSIEAAGFSTINIGGILSNTANKFLLEGFNHVEGGWRTISAIRPVTDFKTITSYRMTGAQQYQKVAPGGEIKHGTLGEESFTNAAETYGLLLSADRRDIINDDMGAITSVPRRLGRGAGLKLNDVFWTEFLDNASFFSTGNSNLVTSATYVLGAVGLKKTVETFRKLTDADGKPLGIAPKFLLVPPELEVTADELFVSTNNNTGGSATTEKVPNRNVFAGKYQPVVSTYLSNTSYSGYSVTGYYLIADPMDLALIETCFLNGQQSPTIETADADFNVLGIQMRGYHDFGVTKQDHRAGVRANGA